MNAFPTRTGTHAHVTHGHTGAFDFPKILQHDLKKKKNVSHFE